MPLLGGWMTDVVGPKDPIFYGILLSIAGALMVLRPQSQEKRETAII
jgi:dipeptide/tripeptide permease